MVVAIEVIDLCKKFDDIIALDHVNFKVEQGEVFGYLGPNGAGKSTTIRILAAISRPTSGKVFISNHDIEKEEYQAKKLCSLVPENPIIYPEMSGWNNLIFTAGLYRVDKKQRKAIAETLLRDFDLYDRRDQFAMNYSKGMKRRLSIAMGMVSNPEILFLDEPTSGLDVSSQRLIRNMVREFQEKGVTIFLTTHNLIEAAQLCDRVAILDKGKILTIDSPKRLKKAMVETRSFEIEVDDPESVMKMYFQDNQEKEYVRLDKNKIRIYTTEPAEWGQQFLLWAMDRKIVIESFRTAEANLEDVFVTLTGAGKLGHWSKKEGKNKGNNRR
ncbi:MAG: ABC transporter ATP-binding protein [Candidatus Hodarchaeales archaeon]